MLIFRSEDRRPRPPDWKSFPHEIGVHFHGVDFFERSNS